MGIPEGSTHANKRELIYQQKRMFFCTPQTLLNDLQSLKCSAYSIVCIVIDEAHRATTNYAYTTAIQEISNKSNNFRILALSATPGSDIRKVQNVSILFIILEIYFIVSDSYYKILYNSRWCKIYI